MTFETPSQRQIVSIVRRSIRNDTNYNFNGGVAALFNDNTFQRMRPMSELTPLEMDITWGLTEAPTDGDELEIYLLTYATQASLPLATASSRSYWGDVQHWEGSGTPAQIIQTLNHEQLDFFNVKGVNNFSLANRIQQMGIGLALGADAALTLDIIVLATLTFQEVQIQRKWKDDFYTWSDYDQEKEGTSATEEEVCLWGF